MRKISVLYRSGPVGLVLLITVLASRSQIIPKQPNPFSAQPESGNAACSLQKSCAELAPAMIASALGPSPLDANLRHLTAAIGGRMTGTRTNGQAVAWALTAFRAEGISNVKTEFFTVPEGWSEGATSAKIISPDEFALRLASTGWSPPILPPAGITAQVVDVGAGDAAGFVKAGEGVHGAIVFVHQNLLKSMDDLLAEDVRAPAIVERASHAHAAAIFWMSTRSDALLYRRGSPPGEGTLDKIPQAIIARTDAQKIARILQAGHPVRAQFQMPNRSSGPFQAQSVVAEIRGWDKPDDFVVLGAHLDSWDLGDGALDDGCNAAMIVDAARVIHASGSLPRRSIRFVLFNAEEQGFLGSRAYNASHRAELDHAIAAIVFDRACSSITGYSIEGRKDLIPALHDLLGPLKSLGVTRFTDHAAMESDSFGFLLQGVPVLLPDEAMEAEFPDVDSTADVLKDVSLANLKKESAIAAITAYALADSTRRFAARQSWQQIEQLLKGTGLDQQMKLAGLWSERQKHERVRR